MGRVWALAAWGVLALACAGTPLTPLSPFKAEVTGETTTQTTVGGPVHLRLSIHNSGPDMEKLAVIFQTGSGYDNWLDHHDVTDAGSCQLDRKLKGFRCGALKSGATAEFDIMATAKHRGTFKYELAVADVSSSRPRYVNEARDGDKIKFKVEGWSEEVVPE
jgi:hypothetical protein